jgi:uncharacterized repeat protein (TIGR01451 family)
LAGWSLKSLTCTQTGNGTSSSTTGATASITMAAEGEVDCTYVNHTNLSPTITTSLASSSISVGDTTHDTATLHNATANAGGSVDYRYYSSPSACTADTTGTSGIDVGSVTVNNGIVPQSPDATFNSAGTFYWAAFYSGDANNNPAKSDCSTEALAVNAANITITKTADASPVNAGDPIGFTVTVNNTGTGTAHGVTVSDPLPAGSGSGVTWTIDTQSNSGLCTTSGAKPNQSLNCGPTDLAGGASFSVHVTATTSPAECTQYDNTATAASTNDGGGQASASITCNTAQIHIVKTADAKTVNAGDPIGFTIVVSNSGPGQVTGVSVNDPLPAGSGSGVTWTIDSAPAAPATCSIGGTPQVLSCSDASLAANGNFTVHITATTSASECTQYNNTANVTTTNDGTDQSSASITCNPASIHILKTADAASVNAGDPIGFHVVVSNSGAGTATGVMVNDPLPAGSGSGVTWSIQSQSLSGTGACTITGSAGSQTLVCGPVSVPAGGSFTVHITAQTSNTECSTYNNTANVTTTNDGTDQSSASITCHQVVVSQITPTATTCSQFSSGTSATLSTVQYSVKSGKISQVNPGVFFYWVKVQATAGSNTVTINQAITTGNFSTFFAPASGSGVFTAGCATVGGATFTQSGAVTTIKFTAASAGTYIIGVKYSTSGVVGQNAPTPPTVHYTFTEDSHSNTTQGLDLTKK